MEFLKIDVRTVILLLAIGNLIAACLLAVYRQRQDVPPLYLAARLAQSLAWFLLWQLGALPFWLTYMVGNIVLNAGWVMEAYAMLTIAGPDPRLERACRAFGVLSTLVIALLYHLDLSTNLLNYAASLLALLIFIFPAFLLTFEPGASPFRRAFGVPYMVFCAALLYRAVFIFNSPEPVSIMTPSIMQTIASIAVYSLLVFGNIGYVLLLKEKTDTQLLLAATTDALTGILNRRAFFDNAQATMNMAVRRQEPVTLLLVDLDRFKRINDSFGHPVGDTVLMEFAANTRGLIRPYDVFGRIGGEEFAIVHLGRPDEAAQVAERVRVAAETQSFATAPGLRYTISVGGYTLVPQAVSDLDAMMRRCDEALYQAKDGGRNRVVMAGATTPADAADPAIAGAGA